MRQAVTVSIPKDLVGQVNVFCRRQSLSFSELTRQALKNYLYEQKLELLRREFTLHAQGRGIFSEKQLIKKLESSKKSA